MAKGKKCGQYATHVVNPDSGDGKWFMPGDDFGDWAKLVNNPLAFEDVNEESDEYQPLQSVAYTAPPPQHGKGSGVSEWFEYATYCRVPVNHDMSRNDLIAAVAAAGFAT